MTALDATARVLRFRVPVDGQWHHHELAGAVLHVDSRQPDVVEFWAYDSDQAKAIRRTFVVFGTGTGLPWWATTDRHRGSVVTPGGHLVWHLFEVPPDVRDQVETTEGSST